MKRFFAALLLAACASTPDAPEVVSDPGAQPMSRTAVEGFEHCIDARGRPYAAQVEVRLTTDENGFVDEASVVQSTDPCLNEAVLTAVRRWRYPPKLVDGALARRKDVRAFIRIVDEGPADQS